MDEKWKEIGLFSTTLDVEKNIFILLYLVDTVRIIAPDFVICINLQEHARPSKQPIVGHICWEYTNRRVSNHAYCPNCSRCCEAAPKSCSKGIIKFCCKDLATYLSYIYFTFMLKTCMNIGIHGSRPLP